MKHKQSKDSSYSEKSSFDNQCQLQLQSNTTISNVEDNSLSASPSPKSHDKDENIEINENQDKYTLTDGSIPDQNFNGYNSAKPVLSSVSIQKSSEIVQIQNDPCKTTEPLTEDSSTLNNDNSTEESKIIMHREHSESACINSQLSETVSRTNSPKPEESQDKDEPV